MKTLLVLAETSGFCRAIRSAINPEQYRVLHRANLNEAEPLLVHGLIGACVADVELTSIQGLWFFEKLRQKAPKCPVIIYTGAKQWEWEEEAYLHGANSCVGPSRSARACSPPCWSASGRHRPHHRPPPAAQPYPSGIAKPAEAGTGPGTTQTP